MEQMCFTNTVKCPKFTPNRYRKNICSRCQNKIQDHASATEKQIAHAIEYIADAHATLILDQKGKGPSIYMGGFKAALNLDFLKANKIGLIICAAKNLAITFGPSYSKKAQKRSQELPHIKGMLILDKVYLCYLLDVTAILSKFWKLGQVFVNN